MAKKLLFLCLCALNTQHLTAQLLYVYPTQGEGQLEVKLETGGSARIIGWDKPEIAIEADLLGRDSEFIDFDIEESPKKLLVRSAYLDKQKNMSGRVDLNVKVPRAFNITFSGQGGSIHIEQLNGQIYVNTTGGKIHIYDVVGKAKLATTGAMVRVGEFVGDMEVRTTGANIEIAGFQGPLLATTTAGNIVASMTNSVGQKGGDIKLNTTMGNVTLHAPEDLSAEIDITLAYTRGLFNNYKIKSSFDLATTKTNSWDRQFGSPRKFIYGKALINGGEHEIQISTTNGHVHLDRLDAEKD